MRWGALLTVLALVVAAMDSSAQMHLFEAAALLWSALAAVVVLWADLRRREGLEI
jgi:hypothetical protein